MGPRWPVLVNVKAAKSSADGGHFLSELEVMASPKFKPEVFNLSKSKTESGRDGFISQVCLILSYYFGFGPDFVNFGQLKLV